MSIFVDIEKKLGSFHLNAAFEAGNEVLSLLGASGCGKSVTLQCIAGIMTPDRGKIVLDGVTLFDSEKKINLPPQKRRVGLLFQNYALFPNMTVLENLRAGCRRTDRKTAEAKVHEMLSLFELEDLQNHFPAQLSGGQQQRTALARILLSEPNLLLLDEPFSALDSHLRFRLERELEQVMARFGKTVILVSHDRDEVYRLSQQVLILHDGKMEDFGPRDRIFRSPGTRAAAILTGCKNIAPCEVLSPAHIRVPQWGMTLQVPPSLPPAYVGIRMHDIVPGEGMNSFRCQVVSVLENPFSFVVMLRPADAPEAQPIGWELSKEQWLAMKQEIITIQIPPEAVILCCR